LGQWTREFQARIEVRPPTGDTPADRVVDVLQRAARALERSPNLMAAFVTGLTSLSGEDPVGLAEATEVYGLLHEFVTYAMDGDEIADREAVVRVIGEVWLATLIASVRGWARPGQLAEGLEAAVRRLLPA